MGLHGDAKVILTVEDDQVRLSPIGHGAFSSSGALSRACQADPNSRRLSV
ncbi:hypothetical protein [Sphingomonas aerolata]